MLQVRLAAGRLTTFNFEMKSKHERRRPGMRLCAWAQLATAHFVRYALAWLRLTLERRI